MTESESAAGAAPPAGHRPWRIVGLVGEILITAGVVLLLAVVYELWWTNIVAERDADQQRQELVQSWEEEPPPAVVVPIPSQAFGLMYIPRVADDVWATPLIEGVQPNDLTKGIGRFPDSAMPGEVGNTAFAGHRATHGEPLAHVDQLQVGDKVYIETGAGWYTYELERDQLVAPTDVWVVDPVPGQPAGTEPTESILTLVTCHPRWGSTQRWIWWGTLVDQRTWEQGAPPELAALLSEGA